MVKANDRQHSKASSSKKDVKSPTQSVPTKEYKKKFSPKKPYVKTGDSKKPCKKSYDSPKKPFVKKDDGSDSKQPYKKANDSQKKDYKNNNNKGNSSSKKSSSEYNKDYKTKKPNYSLVEKLKVDWNKIRVKTLKSEDRHAVMDKMAERVKGRILQITLRHDVSRIIQSILQFGSPSLRSLILSEISGKILEICKTPYGHFTILKAISYCTNPEDQKIITTSLSGHFVSLGTNVIGSRIVESILALYSKQLTKDLKAEFYGRVS